MNQRSQSAGPPPLESILAFLRSAEIRLRLWHLLEFALWAVAVGCIVLLLGVGARAFRETWAFAPPAFAVLAVLLGAWAVGMLAWKGLRKIPLDRVAFLVEQRRPELNNSLISSVQLAAQGEAPASASLVNALYQKTTNSLKTLDPSDGVDRSLIQRPLRVAGLFSALTLAVGLANPDVLAGSWDLLMHPVERMPVRAVVIETAPRSGKVLLGQPVIIRATTAGRRVARLGLEIVPDGESRFRHRTAPVTGSFTYRAFAGEDTSPPHRLEAVPPPVIDGLRLSYSYPRYTKLPREEREGSGSVRALKGTEIALDLQVNKPLESGRLVFGSGADVPLDLSDPTRPRGRFIVMENDQYRIVLQDRWGFENPQPVRYPVEVVPDQPPSVEMLHPRDEVTIAGDETLVVRSLARDDFGIHDVRLVAEVSGGGRKEFTVSKLDGASRWDSARFEWDLRELELKPSAVIQAHLVVRDNDTISGPKEGVSKTVVIRVRSPEEEHKRVKDLQKGISERMLDLLASQLDLEADTAERLGESPDGLPAEPAAPQPEKADRPPEPASPPAREDAEALRGRSLKIEDAVRELIDRIDQALTRVSQDRNSGYESFSDLNALRSNLFYLQREMMPRGRHPLERPSPPPPPPDGTRAGPSRPDDRLRDFQKYQKDITAEMERMAVFADDIGKRGQLRDLANLGRQLTTAQNRLLDAFDQAKQGDPAAQKALREAMAKLQELMNQLMQGLRNLPVQLPDEFLNMPTPQTMNLSDLSRQLRDIQRKIAEGDIEAARKLAEQMVKSLSQMIAAMQGAFQQAMNRASTQFGQSAQRQQNILQQLMNRQREILEETRKIEKPVQEKFRALQEDAFQQAGRRADRALNTLRRLERDIPLPPWVARALEAGSPAETAGALKQSLSRRETPQAAGHSRALGDLSRKLSEAALAGGESGDKADSQRRSISEAYGDLGKEFAEVAHALENLPRDPRVVLEPEQRKRLGELKGEQGEVQAKTDEVRKQLERLMKLMPFLSPEIAKNLGNAGEAMGKAVRELEGQRADQAVPQQRDAIYWLSRAGNSMRGAMQQMAQRGRFGGAPAPSVIQPGGARPGLALQWRRNVGEEEGGRSGASTQDFRLPGKDAYRVPKTYREEVVDALKGKYPPAYREQIEQYFKNLVE